MKESLDAPAIHALGILLFVVLGAAFATLDAALRGLGEAGARAAIEGGGQDAKAGERYLRDRDKIHARLPVGRSLCIASAAVIGAHLAWQMKLPWSGPIAIVVIAFMYGSVAEFFTSIARTRSTRLALPMLRLFRPLELVVTLPAAPLAWLTGYARRVSPPAPEDVPERVVELQVEAAIEQGQKSGAVTEEFAELMRSVADFKDTTAKEVMVPRMQMASISVDTPIPEVVARITEEGHSRYPIHEGDVDQIVGVLVAKDLFRAIREGVAVDLRTLARKPVLYVVEHQKVQSVLREMQTARVHLAVVADAYGGVAGIVTLEDIVEVIVGEIQDEHDVDDTSVQELSPGRYLADASLSVSDVVDKTGFDLPEGEGEYDSLAGMIIEHAGKVPATGESVSFGDVDLIVREADARRISRVEIVRKTAEPQTTQTSI